MLKKKKKVLKVLKPFKNIYLLILIAFIIWMTMFDANSWLIHADLNKDIDDLNSKIEFYNSEISKDQKEINTLNSTNGIEKYAREHYKMKKDNEVIYIIEDHDSLKTTTNE
jgi:cell division protein FtsL